MPRNGSMSSHSVSMVSASEECALLSVSRKLDAVSILWSIWNNSFLNCGCRWEWRMIIAVNFPNLNNWKEEAWKKNQGFNGIRTRDLRVAGALLYQLSYEAIHWERGQFIELYIRREYISKVPKVCSQTLLAIVQLFGVYYQQYGAICCIFQTLQRETV